MTQKKSSEFRVLSMKWSNIPASSAPGRGGRNVIEAPPPPTRDVSWTSIFSGPES